MSVDRSYIDGQLRALGEGTAWWDEREFRELPGIMQEGEQITGLAWGVLLASTSRKARPRGSRRQWLFVATDRRILCLQEDGFARRELDIEKDEIASMTHRYGLQEVRINLGTGGLDCQLRIPRSEGVRFVDAVNRLLPYDPRKQLPPEVEVFAWIPGITRVAELPIVSRIISRVAMLSPPDPGATGSALDRPRDPAMVKRVGQLEEKVEQLQFQIERLQEGVEFLEGLLQEEFRGRESVTRPRD